MKAKDNLKSDLEYFTKKFGNKKIGVEAARWFVPLKTKSDALAWRNKNHEVYELCKEHLHGETVLTDHLIEENSQILRLHRSCLLGKSRKD